MAATHLYPQAYAPLRRAEQCDLLPIRVVIVDEPLIAEMQRVVLEQAGDIQVLGVAAGGAAGLALIEQQPPDVVILEPCLQNMDGLEVVRRVHALCPRVGVLLVTAHERQFDPQAQERLGVRGFLPKTAHISELVAAVRAVARGRTIILSTGVRASREDRLSAFTERERAVLGLLAAGRRTAEIAETLAVSTRTVERQLAALRIKLEARTWAELVLKAQQHGLLHPGALVD